MLLILSFLSALGLVSASVSVSYSLVDQLPPIARIHAPYNWTISPNTFISDDTLRYSASALPSWLSFNNETRTFTGTPSDDDEGTPKITIMASDLSFNSASSSVMLCVTPYPAPELKIPVETQFSSDNPSLSSVFFISNKSALYTSRPALRVPPKWSFSIGFEYDTFAAKNSLYYAARQSDGSPLPSWVDFSERAMTFNGVTPQNFSGRVPLVLHASDQKGYTAQSIHFDIVVSAHDFTMATNSLPTINVTAGQPFQLTLNSDYDFSGVLLDDGPVSPANITSLEIDTSDLESWLRYDSASKTLSGEPPMDFDRGVLPVLLTSYVNQTLKTEVTLAAVPSFFSADTLDPILVSPGDAVSFNLAQFFTNSSGLGDVSLSAAYKPLEVGSYLAFVSPMLNGSVPAKPTYDHIDVTFTAYSHVTHSTSHTTLPISLSSVDYANQHDKKSTGGLSTSARKKLLLALKLTFGIICGFVTMAVVFALMRRCSQVPDSAIEGEEGRKAWTAGEMRWYGIGIEGNGEKYQPPKSEHGYGWSEGIVTRSSSKQEEDGFGMALSRVLTRTLSNVTRSPLSPVGHPQSPGMIKKIEFMGKIRATARIVSDKYRRVVSGPRRPIISKPTLILTDTAVLGRTDIDGLPNTAGLLTVRSSTQPFQDTNVSGYATSGISSFESSPSSSTNARSIPRRRADFAPPKVITTPPQARLSEHHSVESLASSLATQSSTRTHEAEAIVQRATRATSVRSGASGVSFQTEDGRRLETARPRLVPFTSAARVPVPKLPSSFFPPDPSTTSTGAKRVVSQMAKVFRNPAPPAPAATQAEDELQTGMEYVRALGDDRSSLAVSHAGRSSAMSFSSLESSQHGHGEHPARALTVPRMLARAGQRFKFRVPIAPGQKRASMSARGMEARLVSGRALPKFIKVDVDTVAAGTRTVELWGVPGMADVGEYEVGVYVKEGGECVGRVLVEVIERKSG